MKSSCCLAYQLYAGQEARCGRLVKGWQAVAPDTAALGAAFASPDSNKGLVAFATANVLALTALDEICAQQPNNNRVTA